MIKTRVVTRDGEGFVKRAAGGGEENERTSNTINIIGYIYKVTVKVPGRYGRAGLFLLRWFAIILFPSYNNTINIRRLWRIFGDDRQTL